MSTVNETLGITMSKLKEMIDVNAVIGDPITTPDGTTLIPVSHSLLPYHNQKQ